MPKPKPAKPWVHLSTAMNKRMPTWDEINMVRNIWLPERRCIMVVAPPDENVNIHANCMHLWHCLGKDPVPDFTHGGTSL